MRLAERCLGQYPLVSTRLACITHAKAPAVIGYRPLPRSGVRIAALRGHGIRTIAGGTLPLAIFGAENYAYRLGLIGAISGGSWAA
jgi:hypothetical protein